MSVYKHENGNWYCRGRINGERYHTICRNSNNKEEAKLFDEQFRLSIRNRQSGIVVQSSHITFKFLMDKLLENYYANSNDIRTIKPKIKYLTNYFGADKNINSIRPSDIEKFKSYMLSIGKKNATINRYLSALKRAYNILIADDLINYNPVNKVKKLDEDNKRYRYLSKAEWNKLKLSMPEYLHNIVVVALLTGLRLNNVLTLRWEQIDFSIGFLEVLKQDNKGKKDIKIPISDLLLKTLQDIGIKELGYVFVNPDTNKPYTDIRKSFKTALNKAGIIDFKFHDLRRTFGTWLIQSGVDLRTIQYLLAHSDISTTERYLSISDERNKFAINKLNNFIV